VILPQSADAVMFLMVLSMLCLGSWANAYKLAGKWRYELFYFDFAIGLMLATVLYAATVGNLGYDGFSFWDDFLHAGKRQWVYAFLAGLIFNFGNMLLLAAVSVAGMAVAFPIGMGVAILIGTGINFATRPAGNTLLILLGCALIVSSIVVNAMAYRIQAVRRHEELARAGTAKSTRRPTEIKGIIIALVSGLFIGSFTPLMDKARVGDYGLGPYAVGAMFTFAIFISSFVFNIFLMNLPVHGEPLELGAYLIGRKKQHILGIAAGFVWCTGAMAALVASSTPEQLQGGQVTRGLLGQGAPLIAALWGLLVWKEYRGGDVRVKTLVTLMVFLLACGLALVALAPLYLPAV
jgi:glucose uptake protein